ncbi:hypothetical protein Ctha_0272 [Chloroherpeton thalassium ATCC 35110]|uniref:Putative tail fiber protein gp53-like C-terminal domain-containing protein n=1 Tax=Chloroherpeton thalassium (strain ATCC 35110 / GB-78) TaxID=517418 RepID=B3QTJ7_CHLT3|nr:hypothetical protein [Chloroherpeton thalassium]ACF12743.1 hypothetical protein Ctha_0272 [Chloroherpeton thalassium ATCC 35110]
MAHITEESIFHEKIYQIGTEDPVKGGTPVYSKDGENITSVTDGHANVQAKLLADRTQHLNEQLTALKNDIASGDYDESAGTLDARITALKNDIASGDYDESAGTIDSRLTAAEGEIDDILNPSNTMAQTGYCDLPGGLRLQWGYSYSGTDTSRQVSFPVSFTGDVYSVVCQTHTANSTIYVAGFTSSSFHTVLSDIGVVFSWIAIGKAA